MASTPGFAITRTMATATLCIAVAAGCTDSSNAETDTSPPSSESQLLLAPRLEPLAENPWYWSYDGEPVLPIGSNLIPGAFQYHKRGQFYDYIAEELDPLAEHLDGHWGIVRVALHPGGGQNYQPPRVSPPGGGDWDVLAAYEQTTGGVYDLDRFNEEYWTRLREYLVAAKERRLFAWIELWDTHVYARLAAGYPDHDVWDASPFFPPNHRESQDGALPARAIDFLEALSGPALHYKQAFIRKLLETTADLGTVLYLHDNENELTQSVREHWAEFINDYDPALSFGFSTHRDTGFERDDDPPYGRPVEESWIEFFDTGFQWKGSQECNDPRAHARRVKRARERVAARSSQHARRIPVGGTQILAYPWHNLFYGAAAVRFHRLAAAHYADCYNPDETWAELLDTIQILARFANSVPIHTTEPDDTGRFTRGNDRALSLVDAGRLYLVYLDEGGRVEVDLRDATGDMNVRWFDPRSGAYEDHGTRATGAWGSFTPPAPSNEEWILVIEPSAQTGSNQPPEVFIDQPPAGATISGPVDIVVSLEDDGAVAELRVYVDDTQIGNTILDPAPTEVIRWDPTADTFVEGRYQIRAEAVDEHGASSATNPSNQILVEVEMPPGETPSSPPQTLSVGQNVPNPFNPLTTIEYVIEQATHVRVRVYDAYGTLIRTLADGFQEAGVQRVRWDATNRSGLPVVSGVYFYRVEAAGRIETRKMILLQ